MTEAGLDAAAWIQLAVGELDYQIDNKWPPLRRMAFTQSNARMRNYLSSAKSAIEAEQVQDAGAKSSQQVADTALLTRVAECVDLLEQAIQQGVYASGGIEKMVGEDTLRPIIEKLRSNPE
jgi:hypothetical protein